MVLHLRPIGAGDQADAQVAGIGIEPRPLRPGLARGDVEPGQPRRCQGHAQRVFAAEEAAFVGRVFHAHAHRIARQRGARRLCPGVAHARFRHRFRPGFRPSSGRGCGRCNGIEPGAIGSGKAPRDVHLFGRQRAMGLEHADPAGDIVQPGEQFVGHGCVHPQLAIAHRAQQVFPGMDQVDQRRQIEQARRALDRMDRAEQRIDRLAIVGIGFQRQQRGIGLLYQGEAFLDKAGGQFRRFAAGQRAVHPRGHAGGWLRCDFRGMPHLS
jgi:hypothetical protein